MAEIYSSTYTRKKLVYEAAIGIEIGEKRYTGVKEISMDAIMHNSLRSQFICEGVLSAEIPIVSSDITPSGKIPLIFLAEVYSDVYTRRKIAYEATIDTEIGERKHIAVKQISMEATINSSLRTRYMENIYLNANVRHPRKRRKSRISA